MPSDRRQLNVRLDPQTSELWDAVYPRVRDAIGVELSQAQVVALAVRALSEKYPESEQAKPGRDRKGK